MDAKRRPQSTADFIKALRGQLASPQSTGTSVASGSGLTFKFKSGAAHSLHELIDLSDRYWDEAQDYLFNGYFESYLAQIGEAALAKQAHVIAAGYKRDQRKGLELFMRDAAATAGLAPYPSLTSQPASLSLGSLPLGAQGTVSLQLINNGRGYAWGNVYLQPPIAGLKIPAKYEGSGTRIDLQFDFATTPSGQYRTELIIQTEGVNVELHVPISFEVQSVSLSASPSSLIFGGLIYGTRTSRTVHISTTPQGGRINGTAVLRPPIPGVSVESSIEGIDPQLRVAVDTAKLEGGKRFASKVIVDTNAGQCAVPLSFATVADWSRVLTHTMIAAVVGAIAFGMIRALLTGASPAMQNWFLKFSSESWALWMGGMTTGVLGLVILGLVRSARKK
jgi:hypothetical protein